MVRSQRAPSSYRCALPKRIGFCPLEVPGNESASRLVNSRDPCRQLPPSWLPLPEVLDPAVKCSSSDASAMILEKLDEEGRRKLALAGIVAAGKRPGKPATAWRRRPGTGKESRAWQGVGRRWPHAAIDNRFTCVYHGRIGRKTFSGRCNSGSFRLIARMARSHQRYITFQ